MNKNYKILLVIAASVYVIYHLVTLIYSPLPWYDEITFNAITHSYVEHRTFFEEERIIALPQQKLDYGPLYFIIQAGVIKIFGFSIFKFRITSLLCGLIDLFLIYKICRKLKFTANAIIVTLLIIALEPAFNQSLHSGRMDFTSMLFFFLSYLTFVKTDNASRVNNILWALVTGILLSCAMLTTPRIIFAFSFYFFYFIFELTDIKTRGWQAVFLKYIGILIGFVAVYYIWIYSAFGSIGNFIYYNTHSSVIKDHAGGFGSGISLKYNLLVYAYAIFAFLLLLKNKVVRKNIDMVLFTVPVILAFLVIVTGGISGRYFAMVIPFAAILITGVTVNLNNNGLLKKITYVIPVLFGIIFIFKGTYIFATLRQHDPYYNESVISKYIAPNSSIAGDFRYYYIARDKNCSFLSFEGNGPLEDEMKYYLDHKINYFIINKDNPEMDFYVPQLLTHNYKLETVVEDNNSGSFFHKIISKLPYRISENYSCYIYKYQGVGG